MNIIIEKRNYTIKKIINAVKNKSIKMYIHKNKYVQSLQLS